MTDEKKYLGEMEFALPHWSELITREKIGEHQPGDGKNIVRRYLKFGMWDERIAFDFCRDILTGVSKCSGAEYRDIRSDLAKLVEEKFGMKVRTCMNCKFYKQDHRGAESLPKERSGLCEKVQVPKVNKYNINPSVLAGDTCIDKMLNGVMNFWEPKEVSG